MTYSSRTGLAGIAYSSLLKLLPLFHSSPNKRAAFLDALLWRAQLGFPATQRHAAQKDTLDDTHVALYFRGKEQCDRGIFQVEIVARHCIPPAHIFLGRYNSSVQ